MINRNKFREKLVGAGKTMEQLAKDIHINQATLYRKVKGASEFTCSDIKGISNALCLSRDELDAIFFADELTETQHC